MDFERWRELNQRRLSDSRNYRGTKADDPDLSKREYWADLARLSDGQIHPWWAYTDGKIRKSLCSREDAVGGMVDVIVAGVKLKLRGLSPYGQFWDIHVERYLLGERLVYESLVHDCPSLALKKSQETS